MSKQNPKAGAEQLQQDIAAANAKQTAVEGAGDTSTEAAPEAKATSVEMVAGEPAKEVVTEVKVEAKPETPVAGQGDVVIPPIETKQPVEIRVGLAISRDTEIPAISLIAPLPAAQKSEPAVASAAIVVDSDPAPSGSTLKDKLERILKNVPPAYQTDLNRIFLYLERMAPNRPIDKKAGAKEQVALYRSIQNIINRQEQYFTPLFSALLAIFKEESQGALSDRYRLRFMESVEMAEGDRKAFMFITHLLFATAEPASRSLVLKQIDMNRVLENGVTAGGRDRVLAFYNI